MRARDLPIEVRQIRAGASGDVSSVGTRSESWRIGSCR